MSQLLGRALVALAVLTILKAASGREENNFHLTEVPMVCSARR